MTLQQIFIINLKKFRKERGFSQMTLSIKCDTTSNYIGQIEMGRRIPSFEYIEKIAKALEIPPFELFFYESAKHKERKQLKAEDYLRQIPSHVKKELVSKLISTIKNDINTSLNP